MPVGSATQVMTQFILPPETTKSLNPVGTLKQYNIVNISNEADDCPTYNNYLMVGMIALTIFAFVAVAVTAKALFVALPLIGLTILTGFLEKHETTTLELGKLEDCAQVVSIVVESFKKAYAFRKNDRLTEKEYLDSFKETNVHWHLLKKQVQWQLFKMPIHTTPSSVVSTLKLTGENQDKCKLEIFATDVKEQGKKYGAKLLTKVENAVAFKSIQISCVDDAKLVKYYENQGYTKTANRFQFDNEYIKPEWHNKIFCCDLIKNIKTPQVSI